jgi:hypothetical protein
MEILEQKATQVTEIIIDANLAPPKVSILETSFPFTDKELIVVNNIPSGIRHKNYLEYLQLCYDNHYAFVLKPEHIWQIILCEVATHIKANAERFRSLFTTSEEKKNLKVHTIDPLILPLHSIIDELHANIPSDISVFFPDFSTISEGGKLACAAAFCDGMSPYYNYTMFMCGLPKVRVEGDVTEWQKINDSLVKIAEMLHLEDYAYKVSNVINNICHTITHQTNEHFKTFFSLVRCGSGGQTEVNGWFTDLYIKRPTVGYVGNYSSCISKIEYKNLSTGKDYFMKVGLLRSKFEGEYLVPDFTFVVYEKGTAPAEIRKTWPVQ